MADQTIKVKVENDADKSIKSIEDLKLELRALETEFETAQLGTDRFKSLGAQVKAARNNLKDLEASFEGLDKEQRATALVDTFNGLTGAVGAVSSAFIAFGAEAGAIEDAEKKLLGVIGVVSGLRDVSNGLVAANKLLGPSFEAAGESIKAAFTGGTAAVNGFKVALASAGIGIAIIAITKLYERYEELQKQQEELAKQQAVLNNISEESVKLRDNELEKIAPLIAAVQQENISRQDRVKIIKEIQKQYPDYLANQKADKASIDDIKTANETLIASIAKRAKAQAALTELGKVYERQVQIEIQLQKNQNDEIQQRNDLFAKGLSPAEVDKQIKSLNNVREGGRKILQNELDVLKAQEQKIQNYINEEGLVTEVTNAVVKNTGAVKDNGKAAEEAAKKRADALNKEKQSVIDINEARRQLAEEQANDERANIEVKFKNDLERLKEQRDKELEQENLTENAKQNIRDKYAILEYTAQVKRNEDLDALDEANKEKVKTREKELADLKTTIGDKTAITEQERRNFEKQQLTQYYDDLIAEATKYGLDITALNEAKNKALKKQEETFVKEDKARRLEVQEFAINSATSLIGDLKSLNQIYDKDNEEAAKKAFEREKALSIVETILSTYLAASKAYASQIIPGDPTSVIRAQVAAGVAIVGGLARLAVIKSQTFDGGGSTGGGAGAVASSQGSVSGGGNILNPFSTQGGGTNILPPRLAPPSGGGQQGTQIGNQQQSVDNVPIVKAYVLAGDVTDAQVAEAKINQKRKL